MQKKYKTAQKPFGYSIADDTAVTCRSPANNSNSNFCTLWEKLFAKTLIDA